MAMHQSTTITLQQLTSFGMRNIDVADTLHGELLDVYFKLVLDDHVIYVSEIARNTLNPVWMPFQPEEFALSEETQQSVGHLFGGTYFNVVVVRVRDYKRARRQSRALSGMIMAEEENGWASSSFAGQHTNGFDDADDARSTDDLLFDELHDGATCEDEILNVNFHIQELEVLPVGLSEILNLPLNTCLLEFNSQTYVKREVIEFLVGTGVISSLIRRRGSAVQLKDYNLHDGANNLERVRVLRQKIEQVTMSNAALQEQITQRLSGATTMVTRDQHRAQMEERIRLLRQRISDKREALQRVRNVMQEERRTFETDIHIPKALLSIMQMSIRHKDEKQGILERRYEVLRVAHRIRARQAELVRELAVIYPIDYVGVGDYVIRGVRAHDLTAASSMYDEDLSTALGYIAHLVFMLSKYLQVNLRYKIVCYASRSFLKDEINDPHGEYPLYRRGVERDRFERAVALLREDVKQLMFARGLDPTQNVPILASLRALMDAEAQWLLTNPTPDRAPAPTPTAVIRR